MGRLCAIKRRSGVTQAKRRSCGVLGLEPDVLNQRFTTPGRVLPSIVAAEALDGSKDIIGAFGPSELSIVSFDHRGDIRRKGGYAAIDAGLIFLWSRGARSARLG